MIAVHILAGAIVLASGAVAMAAPKGGALHRRAGQAFVAAMGAMTTTGTAMAARSDKLGTDISVMAGLLVFYLVGTGLLTVRRDVANASRWLAAFVTLALGVAAFAIGFGVAAMSTANGRIDGVPGAVYVVFGAIALLAALGDVRVLRVGPPVGVARLTRHLWRMGVAMFIATASFFGGQAKLFPDAVRGSGVLAIPILLVLAHLAYWLVRVRLRRRPVASPLPSP